MYIILGTPGSGKSRKIAELAAKDVVANKKVGIFSSELRGEDYAIRMRDYGEWKPELVSVFNCSGISNLVKSIIQGYEKEEFSSVYIDLLSPIKDHNCFELLDMAEEYTGIPIYVAIQANRSIGLLPEKNPLAVITWDQVKQHLK